MGEVAGDYMPSDVKPCKMIFEPILEQGVFRFDCSADTKNATLPSLSFVNPKDRDTPILSNHIPSYIPTCEYIAEQQVVYCELPAGTSLYGTGEVSGQLERTGKRVFTWNTDAWWYGSGTASLYQSHPWVLAVLPNGDAFGILADTTTRCEIDLRKESIVKFTATPTFPVITFGPFASANVVLTSLSHAIGTVFMPPKWALGYHQCRWSYDSDMRVREIAKTFREKRIPCDVIWMDVDHTDGFRTFTFDQENFPSPKSLADDLHGIGFKGIWMVEPGIKCEKGYFVYDTGSENDVWVQTKDGEPFVGNVWPGPCVFPDYTQEKARSWWANLVKDHISNGVDGVWNDMNEPSTTTMPESNIHRGDAELGGHQNHSHYHNVYGMLMARATYDGMKLADPNKRPFVLTRAGFIGSQRYAATWTGDNFSTWVHLHMSISMVLQLGLSGQPLSGPDIGGFDGNATPKLFGRWFGIGAMFPFARGHSQKETVDHEPWSFGEECEEVCRLALKRRYRLMPHIYTLFYLAHTQGSLVASPTFFADSKDPRLRTNENSFLLGPLLVYASTTSDLGIHELKHELPSGIWIYRQRGGSIIPFGPAHQHVGEANPNDDLSLLVALDENGKAEGVMFEDDGESYEYINGVCLLTTYVAELRSLVITVSVSKTEGLWKRPNRCLHVHILLGKGAMVDAWGIDGEVMQIAMPSETEVSKLISSSRNNYKIWMETAKLIPDVESIGYVVGLKLVGTKNIAVLSIVQLDVPKCEWMLVDKCLGLGLLNKFSIDQVNKCLVTWDFGTANLELWSEERPVSKQSPLCISHTYEIRQL
ncbi:heteroglycan glucosidase 1 [Tanacetum coccineum]